MKEFLSWNDYIYQNGTLKNKLNIQDRKFLAWKEEEITKLSLLKNINNLRRLDPFDPESLKKIHKIVFQDIYEWAGQFRNCDMKKGQSHFAPFQFLAEGTKKSFQTFLNSEQSLNDIFDLYIDINVAHHFREGNGRIGRLWLNLALEKKCQKHIDFSKQKREDYLLAMTTSYTEGGKVIFNLFKNNLTDINSKNYQQLFIKNLDASYYYEYLKKYKAKVLYEESTKT